MRHFGDSALSNNAGVASSDTQLTAVSKNEAGGSLARFIHDQYSPANRYDTQTSSFKPEQQPSADGRKTVEIKALGNLFSPAPEHVTGAAHPLRSKESSSNFLNSASEQNKESFAASVIEDFRSPFKSVGQLAIAGESNRASRDAAFEAANCYQSIHINPLEGSTKTITTLSDLSSSRIHIKSADSSSITYTDRLGRPISESRFDASGKFVSETTAQFDNLTNGAIPSKKIVRTANETTEISLDAKGLVVAKVTMPHSDLHNA